MGSVQVPTGRLGAGAHLISILVQGQRQVSQGAPGRPDLGQVGDVRPLPGNGRGAGPPAPPRRPRIPAPVCRPSGQGWEPGRQRARLAAASGSAQRARNENRTDRSRSGRVVVLDAHNVRPSRGLDDACEVIGPQLQGAERPGPRQRPGCKDTPQIHRNTSRQVPSSTVASVQVGKRCTPVTANGIIDSHRQPQTEADPRSDAYPLTSK